MEIKIIFEDGCIVVVDKPSGVVSNRAESVKTETLQDWMGKRYKSTWKRLRESEDEDIQYFVERWGLVHRLDKETSGMMVLAKTRECFLELLRQFKAREVEKEYVALTHGRWKVKEGEIELPLGRMRQDRKKFGVREDGKASVSSYKVLDEYTSWGFPKELGVDDRGYAGFSLVKFIPKTGRTHQIRIHAKHLGHPIVGDFLYAGRKRAREDRKWAGRILLHAKMLGFLHPKRGKRVEFVSEPSEIESVVSRFLT